MTMSGFCLGISWNIYVTWPTKWQAVTQVSLPHTAVSHWVRFFPGCLGNFWSWKCQVPKSDSKYLCLQRLQKASNPLGSLVSRITPCLASMFFFGIPLSLALFFCPFHFSFASVFLLPTDWHSDNSQNHVQIHAHKLLAVTYESISDLDCTYSKKQ